MPCVESSPASLSPEKKVRKLVLCFDGTGNAFRGNTSDTNVVKIYDKLNRDDDYQYHYYQPGIGTYDVEGGSINKNIIGKFKRRISRAIDMGFATSFDSHVIAGYKFLMNYYEPGAKIYMFGFSRGAFTARFLSRMINTVGLLSKGNDEMIPFAYTLYQDYEQAKDDLDLEKHRCQSQDSNEKAPLLNDSQNKINRMKNFINTFCRRDKVCYPGISEVRYNPVKVYFLGMFDCVSSVAVLERPFGKIPKPVPVVGTAEHVRHAVSVDECRVKFKAALLNQDLINKKHGKEEDIEEEDIEEEDIKEEDIKEVWFPGDHSDVGGGWPAHKHVEKSVQRSWWQSFTASVRAYIGRDKDKNATEDVAKDSYQMSDISLSWMMRELELIGTQEEAYAIQWSKRLDGFKNNFNKEEALNASLHNTLSFGQGCNWFTVLKWKFMEYIPIFRRYELQPQGRWVMQTWPPNKASARDIPENALLHASLLHRINDTAKKRPYMPRNNHGSGEPCLIARNFIRIDDKDATHGHKADHTLYALNQNAVETYKSNAAGRSLVPSLP